MRILSTARKTLNHHLRHPSLPEAVCDARQRTAKNIQRKQRRLTDLFPSRPRHAHRGRVIKRHARHAAARLPHEMDHLRSPALRALQAHGLPRAELQRRTHRRGWLDGHGGPALREAARFEFPLCRLRQFARSGLDCGKPEPHEQRRSDRAGEHGKAVDAAQHWKCAMILHSPRCPARKCFREEQKRGECQRRRSTANQIVRARLGSGAVRVQHTRQCQHAQKIGGHCRRRPTRQQSGSPTDGELEKLAQKQRRHHRRLQRTDAAAGVVHANHPARQFDRAAVLQRGNAQAAGERDNRRGDAVQQMLRDEKLDRHRPRHREPCEGEGKQFAPQQRHAAGATEPDRREQRRTEREQRTRRAPDRIVPPQQFSEHEHHPRARQHAGRSGAGERRRERPAPSFPRDISAQKRNAEPKLILLACPPLDREMPPCPQPRKRHGKRPRGTIDPRGHGCFSAASTSAISSGNNCCRCCDAASRNGLAFSWSPAAASNTP